MVPQAGLFKFQDSEQSQVERRAIASKALTTLAKLASGVRNPTRIKFREGAPHPNNPPQACYPDIPIAPSAFSMRTTSSCGITYTNFPWGMNLIVKNGSFDALVQPDRHRFA